jgi:hypothetical protein
VAFKAHWNAGVSQRTCRVTIWPERFPDVDVEHLIEPTGVERVPGVEPLRDGVADMFVGSVDDHSVTQTFNTTNVPRRLTAHVVAGDKNA